MRFYLSSTAADFSAPPNIPTGSTWHDSTDYFAGSMTVSPEGSSTSKVRSETTTTQPWDVLLGSWVTPPLAAGTVSTSFQPGVGFKSSHASGTNKFNFRYKIWAVTPAGAMRGIIRNALQAANEWSTTATGNVYTGLTIPTPLDIEDGDRIVAELGYRSTNTVSTNISGTLYYGGGAGGTDITQGATDMNGTRTYIDFPTVSLLPSGPEPGRLLLLPR